MSTSSEAPATPSTAEQIMSAAETVFVRHGYTDTTVADIAEAADVTRPTFYAYYDSKEDVFRQLAERVRQEFLALQELDGSLPVGQILRQADREYLRVHARHDRLLTLIKHQALGDPGMAELWREIHYLPNLRHMRFIETHVKRGTVTPVVPPSSLVEIMTGSAMRFAELLRSEPHRFEEFLENHVAAHLALIGIEHRSQQ